MDTTFDSVVASYHRARQSGHLFDTFYDLFLHKSADIPPMFARTDFARQKMMLRESILEMLLFVQTGSGQDFIKRLGARHRVLDVRPVHYEMWLDALCEALAKHDPEFSDPLECMWRETMRKG